jgi:hypothetical protein
MKFEEFQKILQFFQIISFLWNIKKNVFCWAQKTFASLVQRRSRYLRFNFRTRRVKRNEKVLILENLKITFPSLTEKGGATLYIGLL